MKNYSPKKEQFILLTRNGIIASKMKQKQTYSLNDSAAFFVFVLLTVILLRSLFFGQPPSRARTTNSTEVLELQHGLSNRMNAHHVFTSKHIQIIDSNLATISTQIGETVSNLVLLQDSIKHLPRSTFNEHFTTLADIFKTMGEECTAAAAKSIKTIKKSILAMEAETKNMETYVVSMGAEVERLLAESGAKQRSSVDGGDDVRGLFVRPSRYGQTSPEDKDGAIQFRIRGYGQNVQVSYLLEYSSDWIEKNPLQVPVFLATLKQEILEEYSISGSGWRRFSGTLKITMPNFRSIEDSTVNSCKATADIVALEIVFVDLSCTATPLDRESQEKLEEIMKVHPPELWRSKFGWRATLLGEIQDQRE